MSVLTATGLTRSHGDRAIFRDLGFTLARGDRLAVVGPNGSGKTTLLRVLAGLDPPDGGRVSLASGLRVGYLPQEIGEGQGLDLQRSLVELAREPLAGLDALEARLRELERAISRAGPDRLPACLDEYGRLAERFETAGGYAREARVRAVLLGLGFRERELELPAGDLSGGQRTRLGLARLLLGEPDLLLLDEPTNHLDLEATAWLEDYLAATRAAFVVVAHDRRFLDRLVTAVLELADGRGTVYKGNYSAYAGQAAGRRAREGALAGAREDERARLEEYVRRYRAGNRAAQASSRQKALDRLEPAARSRSPARSPAMGIAVGRSSGRVVLRTSGLAAGHGETILFSGLNLELRRGDRLGVAGPNGSGKSTLVRVLLGLQEPAAGAVEWGREAEVGYFAQAAGADGEDTGLTALAEFADRTGLPPGPARSFLARFGLTGETPLRDVGELSGGERTRLRLAELVAGRPNVLVLDEPTHHLDLPAREALGEALAAYPGTLVLVTHDRHLLDRVTTRLLYLKEGEACLFEGKVEECLARPRATAAAPPAGPRRDRAPAAAIRRRRQEREALEEAITRLERERARLEELLASPVTYREGDPAAANREYREVMSRLEELYRSWEELAEEEGQP